MANIVLPQAAILSNTASEMKPVVESGGTLYRTSSSTLMANMVNNLAEESKTSFSDLKFIVDDNNNNNNFVANIIYDETPLSFIFKAHQAHIYNNGFKNYKAYIRKADGTYKRVKPHIGFYVPLSIAGIAVAGTAIANSVQ